ncbi:hypothetical protein B0T21DRAFT_367912 [Apiosordaria backusii]|uniref:Uncharacterized protein n=1 Tax=Apiosordaria backusii TaxID=314023 RepID=A0AA40BJP5_9PEZI|nr:hypothetical protein B0T21DRAFT_367912 [Apiosordaria backusii]
MKKKIVEGFVALGWAGLAEAKALKWGSDNGPRWEPAKETSGCDHKDFMMGISPTMTSPPEGQKTDEVILRLQGKRQISATGSSSEELKGPTCGYVSGLASIPLYCDITQSCHYNAQLTHIGCCDTSTSNCPVPTRCLDSTDRSLFTTRNGFTLWCGQSEYPHCLTHIYNDLKPYTLMGCGVAAGSDVVYATVLPRTGPSTTTTSSTSTTGTNTNTPGPTEPPSGGSSTPIGPIVGGVVGGIAALALIGLGIWLLVKMNKKSKAAAAANNQPPITQVNNLPPPSSHMSFSQPPPSSHLSFQTQNQAQHPSNQISEYYAGTAPGFNPMDPRASIAKPSFMSTTTGGDTSPGFDNHGTPSPPPAFGFQNQQPPQGQQQFGGYGHQQQGSVSPSTVGGQGQGYNNFQNHNPVTPPNQYNPGQGQQQQFGGPPVYNPYGGQQQQQQQQGGYVPGRVSELPTERGDGEVRELQ